MIQEYYKNGQVYDFEMNRFYCGIENREQILLETGYIPVFDQRELSFHTAKCGTLALTTTTEFTPNILVFQAVIDAHGMRTHVNPRFINLEEKHMLDVNNLLKPTQYAGTGFIKNVLLASDFANVTQFRTWIIGVFANYVNLNYYVTSELMTLINNELTAHMDQYPVRNAYYKNFNELTFTLLKNNIYELQFAADGQIDTLKKIVYDQASNQVVYGPTYKYMLQAYKSNETMDMQSR